MCTHSEWTQRILPYFYVRQASVLLKLTILEPELLTTVFIFYTTQIMLETDIFNESCSYLRTHLTTTKVKNYDNLKRQHQKWRQPIKIDFTLYYQFRNIFWFFLFKVQRYRDSQDWGYVILLLTKCGNHAQEWNNNKLDTWHSPWVCEMLNGKSQKATSLPQPCPN